MKRSIIVAIGIALLASSCTMLDQAIKHEEDSPNTRPWWCTATDWEKVTGPATGTVDWYDGEVKGNLSWANCKALSGHLDKSLAFARRYPTAGDAEAAGYDAVTDYVPGMGTHHALNWVTPAVLNSPGFNRFNPTFPGSELDGVFDPDRPEVLQYDGNGPGAKLVGYDWYVRTSTGLPPAGLPGNNDWWHHHPILCLSRTTAAMVGVNTSEADCTSRNGINVHMQNYYMLHAWVLPDVPWLQDVFAGMTPCITATGAIRDPGHPCHDDMDAMDHDMSGM